MEADKEDVNSVDDSRISLKDPTIFTTDKITQFWTKYSKEADHYDQDFLRKNGENIEGVLIFAGLFSAVSAAFLVAMEASLGPSPADTTNALLMMLVHSVNNTAFSDQNLGIPVWNGPSSLMVCSQVLGYAALSASLLAALGASLGKQWLSNYNPPRSGTLQDRGRRRQQKLDGIKQWRFEIFMRALPTLIQLALLLFSISLSILLWELYSGVAWMIIAATILGALFYFFITLASLFSPTCPFHTPVSSAIQGTIGITMKSVEEAAQYWAWYTSKRKQKQPSITRGSKMMACMAPLLLSPLLAIAVIVVLATLAVSSPLVLFIAWVGGRGTLVQTKIDSYLSALQLKTLRLKLHLSLCRLRDSVCSARDFMHRAYLDPEPDPSSADARSIAWLLETSTDPDDLMAAAEVVPDATWPEDLNISLPTEHIYGMFIRSIPERSPTDDRALRLGKAFIIMLSQVTTQGHNHVWKRAWQRIIKESKSLKPDVDSDLLFILTIVAKILSNRLGAADCGVEFPSASAVSQPLLAWLLQPLEILLQLENPNQSLFLPEAYRAFLGLNWPEDSELEGVEGVQYCRTFEIFFNIVVGADVEEMDEDDEQSLHELDKLQTHRLKRILEKLKQLDLSKLRDRHGHLIVPLTVLSKLASVPHLKQAFDDAVIDHWLLAAFKEAVGKAKWSGEHIWLFVSCLMKLAVVVDAFKPMESKAEGSARGVDSSGQTLMPSPGMDSKTLLSYLLNKATPATPEHAVYALKVMLANEHELSELASNPDFINCILYATGPGQVYSVREIGLDILVAACRHLLLSHDIQSLASLATKCDLVHFLHRGFLNQEPPKMLKDLLRNSDDEFNGNLLRLLAPALGDPFHSLLTKLHDEPNKIPERDLRDLEIALVLSNDEDRRKILCDHLDGSIAQMPLRDYRDPMALPLAVVVGWLLRGDGPSSESESLCKVLLRPGFGELLFAAWGDPETLEDNLQMLRLLLDCTARWFSMFVDSGTGSSLGLPSPMTITRLDNALDQLMRASRTLSSDIKRALHKLSRDVKQYVQG